MEKLARLLTLLLFLVPAVAAAEPSGDRLTWLVKQAEKATDSEEALLAYRLAANEFQMSPELCLSNESLSDEVLSQLLQAGAVPEAVELWHWRRRQQLATALGERCLPASQSVNKRLSELPSEAAALHIMLLPDRVELLLYSNGQTWRANSPVGASRVANIAVRYSRAVQRGRPVARRYGQRLAAWLLTPLWSEITDIKPELLQLHVDERLLVLPWAALPLPTIANSGEQETVGERLPIAVSASGEALALSSSAAPPKLLFGAVEAASILAAENFTALPGTAREWQQSRKAIKSSALFDDKLNRQSLGKALVSSDFSVLHFATHGEVAANNSFVLLGDGRLSIVELGELVRERRYGEQPLRLVTLSACETAVASDPNARRQARLGLAGVALQAGAETALASLWPVDDAATAELMGEFYRALSRGRNAAQSLQQARRKLRKIGYDQPLFFAGFQLYGSGR